MMKQGILTAALVVGLVLGGSRFVHADGVDREIGAVGPFISMIESGAAQETIAELFVEGYRASVQSAIDHINNTSDRGLESLVRGLEATPFAKEFRGIKNGDARRMLMVAMRREAVIGEQVIKLVLTRGSRDQVKALLARFQRSLEAHQGQNFSVDDLLRRAGALIGYIVGTGARLVVNVPILFTTNLLESLVNSTPEGWSAARGDFDAHLNLKAYLEWVLEQLEAETNEEEWEAFKRRWRRPEAKN